jgi:hypothetical protein
MVAIRKCQSRKHNFNGCGDPRCPEGLSIEVALTDAVNNGSLDEFFAVRDKTKVDAKSLFNRDGFGLLIIQDPNSEFIIPIKVPLNRPEVKKEIAEIDKTIIPSFDNLDELRQHIRDLYHPYARISLVEHKGYENPELRSVSVGTLQVDAGLRGMGVGQHMRSMLTKFADEHELVISGTPTNGGDGQMSEPDDKNSAAWRTWRDKALAHRQRLERFYLRNRYQKNWGWRTLSYNNTIDYLTKEDLVIGNKKWEKQFNPAALEYLGISVGQYVRFPNGVIPEVFAAKRRKQK